MSDSTRDGGVSARKTARRWVAAAAVAVLLATGRGDAQPNAAAGHTDPLNLDPAVREAFESFYNLDYDGSLARFETILKAHPQEPMAYDYVLTVTVMRELYRQDLLDTTYYAHDSFLMTKRLVDIPAANRSRIEELTNSAINLCDQRIKANPNDKNAYFARGFAKGMHSAFLTLADHSFVAAARQGWSARNDSEQALKLHPEYADAKMAVGIQQFAVASLPRFVRILVGIAGVGGSKEKGLDLLRQSAAHGVVTSVESKTALSLFLRHDARYSEAITVQQELAKQYPRDFLFRLEVANLMKDSGNGPAAIALYKEVLADAQKKGFYAEPRLQLAWYGLADTQRGQNDVQDAANGFLEAAEQPNCSDWLRKRAALNAGEMLDLLHQRDRAVKEYQIAAAGGGDQTQADTAKKYLKAAYTGK